MSTECICPDWWWWQWWCACLCTGAFEVRGPYHRPCFLPGHPDNLHLAPAAAPVSNFSKVLLQAPAIMGAAGAEAVIGVVTFVLVCNQAKTGRGQHQERTGQHTNPASRLLSASWTFSGLALGKSRGSRGKKKRKQHPNFLPTLLDLLRRIFLSKSLTCPSPHPVQFSNESPAAVAQTAVGSPGPCREV